MSLHAFPKLLELSDFGVRSSVIVDAAPLPGIRRALEMARAVDGVVVMARAVKLIAAAY